MGSHEAAKKIWSDLTGRSGADFDWNDEIIEEMLEEWAEIIHKETFDYDSWGEDA